MRKKGLSGVTSLLSGGEDARSDAGRILLAAMNKSCALFAQEVLEGPVEDPFNGKFMIAEHHREWDKLLQTSPRLCVLAPRGHGKCTTGDSLIQRADGALIPISEWEGGELLSYDESKGKFRKIWAPASQWNGEKPTIKVTTYHGKTDTVTENHPLLTPEGWVEAKDLSLGDYICTPRKIDIKVRKDTLDELDAWALGCLIGDGNLGTWGNALRWTSDDITCVRKMKLFAKRYGWSLSETSEYQYYFRRNNTELSPIMWIDQFGLRGFRSSNKFIPQQIFQSSNRIISHFIGGLYDADGHCGENSVSMKCKSGRLVRDLQLLLLRFGIHGKLSPVKQGERDYFRLHCTGTGFLLFLQHILGATHKFSKKLNSKDIAFLEENRPLRRNHYPKTQAFEENICWEMVTGLECTGVQPTYGIEVPYFHNYVANGIVSHNTQFFTHAYAIWRASFNPSSSGYIISATQEDASRILLGIKQEIMENDKLKFLRPSNKNKWAERSVELGNGHMIYTRGYGSRVRGAHPLWLVVDDGLSDNDLLSQMVREKNKNYFYSALSPMPPKWGQLVVVGTPFHMDDLYGDLQKKGVFTCAKFAALNEITKEDGSKGIRSLWPELWDEKTLARKRKEIGNVAFTREYLCQPISDAMSVFPSRLFHGEPVEQRTFRMGQPPSYYSSMGIQRVYFGVDLARSGATGADFTVIFVVGVDDSLNRWVLDIIRVKGIEFQQQLDLIKAAAKKYNPDLIYIEANQMQELFGQELLRTTDLPIKKFITIGRGKMKSKHPQANTVMKNKNSLEGGIPRLVLSFENQKWRIPMGDDNSQTIANIWIAEMQSFAFVDGRYRGVGSHDDTVMACWIADAAVRDGGKDRLGTEENYADIEIEMGIDALLEDIYGLHETDEKKEGDEKTEDPISEALNLFGYNDKELLDDEDSWF